MKRLSLVAASSVILLAGSANAELIFGLSSFPAPAVSPTPEVGSSIFSVAITGGYEETSLASNDGTYGSVPGAPINASALGQSNLAPLTVAISATGSNSNSINALVFDGSGFGPANTEYAYNVSGPGGFSSSGSYFKAPGFSSLWVALPGLINTGDVFTLTVSGAALNTLAVIDNIGIVPEPSGAIALAGLLGVGLMMRSRRPVQTATA